MGEALLAGLLAADWAPAGEVRVVEALASRRTELVERFPSVEVTDAIGPADGTVLATKPGDIATACAALGADAGRVLSIAAGVRLADLEAALPTGTAVVRAMPNTPALVGAGVSAIAAGRHAGDADLAWATEVLGAVGDVVTVPEPLLDAVTGLSGSGPAYVFLVVEAMVDAGVLAGLPRDVAERLAIGTVVRVGEPLLDAVTGLSGSGPAYVFLVAESLIEAGVLVGLPRPVAAELAVQTLLGSARLLAESDDGPEALRAAVTSPGGTTAAGLRALEQAGVRAAFLDAVVAATERSRELG